MRIRQSIGSVVGDHVATAPASTQPWDFVSPNQDEISALLKPDADPKRTIVLVGCAMVVGLGLGWAYGTNSAVFHSIIQTETPSRRVPEIKSSGKSEVRRLASA